MKNLILYCVFIVILLIAGCQKRYTRDQARVILNADINNVEQANAQVVLQTGIKLAEEKLNHQKKMDLIQRGAMVVSGACIVAVIILAYLNKGKLALIPLAMFAGCLWSITFIEMDSHYPKFLPIAGGVITLLSGCLAVYYFVVKQRIFGSFKEVVGNVEGMKINSALTGTPDKALDFIKEHLENQSDFTKALVAKVRAKL